MLVKSAKNRKKKSMLSFRQAAVFFKVTGIISDLWKHFKETEVCLSKTMGIFVDLNASIT